MASGMLWSRCSKSKGSSATVKVQIERNEVKFWKPRYQIQDLCMYSEVKMQPEAYVPWAYIDLYSRSKACLSILREKNGLKLSARRRKYIDSRRPAV